MKRIMNFRLQMTAMLWATLVSGLFATLPALAQPQNAIGEITLLLGKVKLAGKEGIEREAVLNAHVYSGDSINTQTGGHLHIRFIDGGMVSVRPGSQLLIEDYSRYDAAAGKTGSIKFKLEHGVMRSITGQWGQDARERFRLNTPFAAIGVRGTDFVVHSTENNLRVMVHSGAVVLSPYGDTCQIDALGPCQGETARELSSQMGRVMLDLQRHQRIPQLLPQTDFPKEESASVIELRPQKAQDANVVLNQTTADSTLSTTPPAPAALIWGRWDRVVQRPGDSLTLPRLEASSHDRKRVAENDYYALYRLPVAAGIPANAQGNVTFNIQSAQAHLVTLAGSQAASVDGGRLLLDFTARQFSTGLNLNSLPTGPVTLQANGTILPDGTFSSANLNTRVKGALTSDLNNAAYLFEKATQQGMLTGIVNWR